MAEGDNLEVALFFPDPRAIPYRPSPFVQAAFNSHINVVKYTTRRYPEYVDHRDTVRFKSSEAVHNCTALLAAAMRGHLDVAAVLLDAGASTEARDCRGATPLCEAVHHKHLDLVHLLCSYGADVNARNALGWTPLIVHLMRRHEANVNARSPYDLRSRRQLTEYLLGEADVTLTTPEGYTPLHVAAMRGHSEVITALLQRSEPHCLWQQQQQHCPDEEGYTPSPFYLTAFHLPHHRLETAFRSFDIPEESWQDVELIRSARKVAEVDSSVDKYVEASQILEIFMGHRNPILFQDLSQMAAGLWKKINSHKTHTQEPGFISIQPQSSSDLDLQVAWNTAQAMLKRAVECYKTRLLFLERGQVLPPNVAEEVGRSAVDSFVLEQVIQEEDGWEGHPDRSLFVEFLLKVLGQVQDRSRVLREQYGCEEGTPLTLIQALFNCFQTWLEVIENSNLEPDTRAHLSAEQDKCNEMGRKFVSLSLYLPNGRTLLWAVINMWGYYSHCGDPTSVTWVAGKPPQTACLLEALLEWDCDKVINIPDPTNGETPLHQVCQLLQGVLSFTLISELASLLVNYGAHLDAVNYKRETAQMIVRNKLTDNKFRRYLRIRHPKLTSKSCRELDLLLQPPAPPLLSCLVSCKLAEWGVARSRELEELLPTAVVKYIRLHYFDM